MERSAGFGNSKATLASNETGDLDIFSETPIEKNIIGGREIGLRPFHVPEYPSDGPLTFEIIPPAPNYYLQLNSVRLNIVCQIRTSTRDKMGVDKNVAPINCYGQALFKNIEIEINKQPITELTAYKTNYQGPLQCILSYSQASKDTHLKSVFYYEDSPGEHETMSFKYEDGKDYNQGYHERFERTYGSRSHMIYTPIPNDFFQTDKLLHPSCELLIRCYRTSGEFLLMTPEDEDYEIQFCRASLFANYVIVNENLVKKHQAFFQKKPLTYPIIRTVVREVYMTDGEQSRYFSNVFNGIIPKSIVMVMVEDAAATGSYKKNPFNFQHFKQKEVYLKVAGEIIPGDTYKPHFHTPYDMYERDYIDSLRNIGFDMSDDHSNGITREKYLNGYYFRAFDLTGHKCNLLCKHGVTSGQVDIYQEFSERLDRNIQIILYASYNASVYIFADKTVKVALD